MLVRLLHHLRKSLPCLPACCLLPGVLLGAGLASPAAQAQSAEIRIIPDRDLSFGTFMVFGSGARTVSASGAVSDVLIVPLEGMATSPAHFTITYDRANNGKSVIDLELEVVMSSAPRIRQNGLEAQLSAFETDLPGALNIRPGQPIRISILNCRTRICSRSFQIGARLDVTRQFGGGNLVIPIPLDVTIVSTSRSGPN